MQKGGFNSWKYPFSTLTKFTRKMEFAKNSKSWANVSDVFYTSSKLFKRTERVLEFVSLWWGFNKIIVQYKILAEMQGQEKNLFFLQFGKTFTLNPNSGGREQLVTNLSSCLFWISVNPCRILQNDNIVGCSAVKSPAQITPVLRNARVLLDANYPNR